MNESCIYLTRKVVLPAHSCNPYEFLSQFAFECRDLLELNICDRASNMTFSQNEREITVGILDRWSTHTEIQEELAGCVFEEVDDFLLCLSTIYYEMGDVLTGDSRTGNIFFVRIDGEVVVFDFRWFPYAGCWGLLVRRPIPEDVWEQVAHRPPEADLNKLPDAYRIFCAGLSEADGRNSGFDFIEENSDLTLKTGGYQLID